MLRQTSRLFSPLASIGRLNRLVTELLEKENENYVPYDSVINYLEQHLGYEVTDQPLTRKVTLTKAFPKHSLQVEFWATSDKAEVEESDNEEDSKFEDFTVPCQATVTRADGHKIAIKGEVANWDFLISHVAIATNPEGFGNASSPDSATCLSPTNAESFPLSAYNGPEFSTLDPVSLQVGAEGELHCLPG
jgi:hypothetical protein